MVTAENRQKTIERLNIKPSTFDSFEKFLLEKLEWLDDEPKYFTASSTITEAFNHWREVRGMPPVAVTLVGTWLVRYGFKKSILCAATGIPQRKAGGAGQRPASNGVRGIRIDGWSTEKVPADDWVKSCINKGVNHDLIKG